MYLVWALDCEMKPTCRMCTLPENTIFQFQIFQHALSRSVLMSHTGCGAGSPDVTRSCSATVVPVVHVIQQKLFILIRLANLYYTSKKPSLLILNNHFTTNPLSIVSVMHYDGFHGVL